jgi:hypothetical protein
LDLQIREAKSEKIEIARRPVLRSGPKDEQRGAFEHELRGRLRAGQAIEQALVGVPREDELKVLSALLGKP